MKKRLITALLVLCMAVGLCACGGNGSNTDTQQGNTESSQDDSQASNDSQDNSEDTNVDDGKIEYKVTLVDANGAPIAGQMVQVCNEETCFVPQQTDENGVATFRLAEGGTYKAKLLTADDDAYVYFETGATELTLTITE